MFQLTPAVKHLLFINAIMFFASLSLMAEYKHVLYLFYPESPMFRPWQVITHMFMHGSMNHILFNMLSLFFIGPLMEQSLGTRKFAVYYIACGMGGAVLHVVSKFIAIHYMGDLGEINVPVVGASGAINGLFVGLAYLYPNLPMSLLFIPIPVKAKYLAMFFIAGDLIWGLSGYQTGIAHYAHLGGALIGFLLLYFWKVKG
ncbi:MAG: rhomboid family intramembrane serine protease [Saprospiraceae bacterium]|nr:rhomboid family intramembrane serine protease [Saprospiraceae bacterium]MBP9211094.1 rhomboid family intramembrane serine protease [Saprospiraceae bacterium]